MHRRSFLHMLAAMSMLPRATPDAGTKLATAARAQVGVTLSYDPTYTAIPYPWGDVPRNTGVCADVVIRAAGDALQLDLQQLVHEDMLRAFDTYPSRLKWGQRHPDPNIDHRRVLNLEAFWRRVGATVWTAKAATPGDAFPKPLQPGDIVTWLLDARLPHVGVITGKDQWGRVQVVHNIGGGAQESLIEQFREHRAAGHYHWPAATS